MNFDRNLFERAFSANMATCRTPCKCGREFWDGANKGYSWSEGEVEALTKDPNATQLGWAVSMLLIEGATYVADCECWVERAKKITEWLAQNDQQITRWYSLRKQEAIQSASNLPEVDP